MTEPGPPPDFAPQSPILTGLRGRCPRCGKGRIFAGFLALRPQCDVCGLDLTQADTGDGPSFFASFIGGFLVLGLGVTAQIAYEPPVWAYVILFLVGALATVALIRPLKGVLTALQYTNKAAEGRFGR